MQLETYWISVCVELDSPIDSAELSDEGGPLVGYYWNLGVSALSEGDARRLVSVDVKDGQIDWRDSTVRRVDPDSLDEAVAARKTDHSRVGIWYRSGRAYFPADARWVREWRGHPTGPAEVMAHSETVELLAQ